MHRDGSAGLRHQPCDLLEEVAAQRHNGAQSSAVSVLVRANAFGTAGCSGFSIAIDWQYHHGFDIPPRIHVPAALRAAAVSAGAGSGCPQRPLSEQLQTGA